MKKFIYLLSAIIIFNTLPMAVVHSADGMFVEGEHAKSINFDAWELLSDDFSNGEVLYMQTPISSGQEHTATFEVVAPEEGGYTLTAVTTALNNSYTSNYFIKVNNDAYVPATNFATIIERINSTDLADLMVKYNLGVFKLKQGVNTVTFMVNSSRQMDDTAILFIDYISFAAAEFGIQSMTASQPLAVFEEGNGVNFDMKFFTSDKIAHDYKVVAKNFWDVAVLEMDLTINPGTESYSMNLGSFDRGYYELSVLPKMGGEGVYTSFSVVPRASLRTKLESPFAMDVAGMWLIQEGRHKEYARALRLSGAQWARERFSWHEVEAQQGRFNYGGKDEPIDALAREGINVSMTYHHSPEWALLEPGVSRLPLKDLLAAYRSTIEIIDHYGDKIDAWEFWNEEDINTFATEPPDKFAVYTKVAAIAANDSNTNPIKVLSGFAFTPGIYAGALMRNDILAYLDVYNFHNHKYIDEGQEVNDYKNYIVDSHMTFKDLYDRTDMPAWLTESGMYLPAREGTTEADTVQKVGQARFGITSTVSAIAHGSAKAYYFVFPYYIENRSVMGMFSYDNKPYPIYSAYSAMTYALGEGNYLGYLNNMPGHAEGYLFDDEGTHAAALWSKEPHTISLTSDAPATLINMMGNETVITPQNGKITVPVCYDPVFVRFGTKIIDSEYTYNVIANTKVEKKELTKEQRVVLMQTYNADARVNAKVDGYKMNQVGNTVTVLAANFNNEAIEIELTGEGFSGWYFDQPTQKLSIPAWSTREVQFTLNASAEVPADVQMPITFTGMIGGKQTSRCTAIVKLKGERDIAISGTIGGLGNTALWRSNITGGGREEFISLDENSVRINLTFNGGDRWAYPKFTIEDASVLAGSDGISCVVDMENFPGSADTKFFVYEKNGCQYYTDVGIPCEDGKRLKFTVRWDDFVLQAGADDDFHLTPHEITHISIGINESFSDGMHSYRLSELGYFIEDNSHYYPKFEVKQATSTGVVLSVSNSDIDILADRLEVQIDGETVSALLNLADRTVTVGAGLTAGEHDLKIRYFARDGRGFSDEMKVTVR